MNDGCQRYFEDPEAHASHLDACDDCRAMLGALEAPVEHRPVAVDALPLAPWEGASHRAWPVVAGGAVLLLAIAVLLFAAAGLSPRVLVSQVPSAGVLASVIRGGGAFVQNAPTGWQIAIGVGFVLVNTVLYFLLRRAPRGVDAA